MVDARNQAEALIHTSKKNLKEFGDKVGEGEKKAIEDGVAALNTALEGEDVEDIKAKTEALVQASMKLGEAMYQASQQEGESADERAADAGDSADDGQVVDADFEEVEPDAGDEDKGAGKKKG